MAVLTLDLRSLTCRQAGQQRPDEALRGARLGCHRRPDRHIADVAGAHIQRQAAAGMQDQEISCWESRLCVRAGCLYCHYSRGAEGERHLRSTALAAV